jgi:histone H3/H4
MVDFELSVASAKRLCKKTGADRVSDAAAIELAIILQEIGVKIAREALDYSIHSRRKTIQSEDIEIAVKKTMEGKRYSFP